MLEADRSDSDEEDDDDEAENNVGKSLNRNACDIAPHQLFHVAMEIRKMLKESKGADGWPPDSSDLTLECATETIPTKLFNFIAWTLGYSNKPVMDERVVMSRSQMCKVVSICQDLVYAEAKGKTISYPGSFLLGNKDPGRRWSHDLLKSSRFLISNPRSGQ
jgi:hypothetical protein